ncbi:uncharacterized protein BCR38DRAFT_357171 [Pseudomassariella vexata]|uniref:Zn(2)-C6 fungal-type domain-containing protein n=1 Tax=Pseudomassariella vexata TaxID=1141098 RepID=A0A1Y2D746_9PEZI|nr:uncharacterized protein BCR38DRAFT_357171 [Pseudomassariella vexata]ORY55102.1 hypothetical protein BCR38DRAFT_357171 [Pseudomassariella vexata]
MRAAVSEPPKVVEDGDHGVAAEGLGDEEHSSKPPPRKRRRIVISCIECHRRKQKCDRKLPCTNCTQRGKVSACRYETGTPLASTRKGSSRSGRERSPEPVEKMPIKAADFGYSHAGTTPSTLGFLKKIEGVGQPLADVAAEAQESDHFGTRERYKSLIRHLPARTFVERLVDVYFYEFNWQYYGIDEPVFRDYLDQWYNLPFNLLSSAGPQGIEPTLRSFPALLFQVLATGLVGSTDEDDERFASLKYAGNMTFEDLALEYSETGVSLLSLLGKRQMSMTTVLAGWVRAAFLKYTGQVTEAWHQVGTAIRDAQEIGLHCDDFDPKPNPNDPAETTLENMWNAQSRRRLWYTLVGCDLHTGAVLGRPTSVDYRTLERIAPVDAPIPKDRKKTPVFPRGESDPPTPLTRALWAFEAMKPLREILDLEKEGPFPKDFSEVEKIHQDLLALKARTPPCFRLENPDTRFDHLPECWWLPYVRTSLPQLTAFNLMALHRPYIFTHAKSREEALKASLDMLEAHRVHFAVLKPNQYKTFNLFFGTFDAVVMIASIFILFPKEHQEFLDSALQHFQWAVERFETMAARNRLAHAALGVLHAVWIRLKKAVGHGFLDKKGADFVRERGKLVNCTTGENGITPNRTDNTTPATDSSASNQHTMASESESSMLQSSEPTSAIASSGTGLTPTPDIFNQAAWPFPADFDFSSLPPMYPMGDVVYNDLTGISDEGLSAPNIWSGMATLDDAGNPGLQVGATAGTVDSNQAWQFGGDFGNDTIWSLLNQFPPY